MEQWITQKQLADLRKVRVNVVHNWVRRGLIDCKEVERGDKLRRPLTLVNPASLRVRPRAGRPH